jgi:hypothetical protein
MATQSIISTSEYRHIIRRDLGTFVERALYELSSAKPFIGGPHIELIC